MMERLEPGVGANSALISIQPLVQDANRGEIEQIFSQKFQTFRSQVANPSCRRRKEIPEELARLAIGGIIMAQTLPVLMHAKCVQVNAFCVLHAKNPFQRDRRAAFCGVLCIIGNGILYRESTVPMNHGLWNTIITTMTIRTSAGHCACPF